MTPSYHTPYVEIGRTYDVLRYGGASPERAQSELGLSPARGCELEARVGARRAGPPGDAMRPRFARHGRHVAAVLAAGGYPVLSR